MEPTLAVQPREEEFAFLFGGCFLVFVIFSALALTALMVWIYCRIFTKTGYHWALGFLMLVPFGGIIVPLILAFGDWPILKELRALKQPAQAGN